MTLFNDLWKKFKETPPGEGSPRTRPSGSGSTDLINGPLTEPIHETLLSQAKSQSTMPSQTQPKSPAAAKAEQLEHVLNAYQHTELESLEKDKVISKLTTLKELVDQPKEDKPELRFTKIKQQLGTPEAHETVRQERWPQEIRCPSCRSSQLKRIPPLPTQSLYNHRYQCLDCDTMFNDDSGTPMEQGLPPLNVWMQCWYLMGCTDSIIYIAQKLGLDLPIVEIMMDRLQKTFNAKKPLTRFLGFEEWNKQSQHLRAQLKEDLLREYERLNANTATAPKDTAEHRRQLNLRRDLTPSTAPPSPGGGGRKR